MYFPSIEKPGAPAHAPEIVEVGPKYCVLLWEPPVSDGGSPITGYIIERADLSGTRWLPVNKTPVKDTMLRITDLHEDIPYVFRVRAENDEGIGEASPTTDEIFCRDKIGKTVFDILALYF